MKTSLPALTPEQLVAPCGLNCAVCRAFLRVRNRCPGCRADDATKPPTRCRCNIKNCETGQGQSPPSCLGCAQRPCPTLRHLDKRYQARYHTSPIGNLDALAVNGVSAFLKAEAARWTCPACGGTLCMHQPQCPRCGRAWWPGPNAAARSSPKGKDRSENGSIQP